MLDRRKALASGLCTVLGAAGNAWSKTSSLHVAVIGAGVAGLAAAQELRSQGCDATVFEARQRIGGRIHTSRLWHDMPVDLGASWIHGIKGNPVTALARSAGARTIATSYGSSMLHIQPQIEARGIADSDEELGERVVARAMALARRSPQDMSLQAAVDQAARELRLTPNQRLQTAFYINGTYEQEYSGSSTTMSARTIDDNEEFAGADVLFPDGYDRVPQFLAQGSRVKLGQAVQRIEWGGRGVTLRFVDGGSARFDAVVVTVPLGVLKSGAIAFDPPLPVSKQEAVDRLGMGLLNKHWLRFDRVFWPPEFDWHEYFSEKPGQWQEWVSLAKNGLPVLLAFSGAGPAEVLEQLDDRAILDQIMSAARTMFGSNSPMPKAIQFTRWRADPFALGSYSFNAVGSSNRNRHELARGEARRLYFAGEATSEAYVGTVHGALLSGRAAARLVLREARPK